MSSPRSTGQRPASATRRAPASASSRASGRETQRSRKGCPECRKRKIKCDENRPECGQCLRSGRVCHVVDSLFRQHCYTFLATSQQTDQPQHPPETTREEGVRSPEAPRAVSREVEQPRSHDQQPGAASGPSPRANDTHQTPSPASSHPQELVAATWQSVNSPSLHSIYEDERHHAPVPPVEPPPVPSPLNHFTANSLPAHPIPGTQSVPSHLCSIPNGLPDEDQQDQYEIAFFLRCFSESPGQWMDVFTEQQSYFSQHIVLLAHMSTLIRYSACAVAAKQLGQMKEPMSVIRQTPTNKLMLKSFADSKLDFLWYGAKYYEKSIQLLAKQISHEELSISALSPCCIYNSALSVNGDDHSMLGDTDDTSSIFQILAACMLCQYEDLSATMRARSGHLDGIFKLFQSHLNDTLDLQPSIQPPEPARAVEAIFWFFVLNDMLDAYVSRKQCRIDPENLLIWQKMGLPIDEHGHLVTDYINNTQYPESVYFRALIRHMCQLINQDLNNTAQWTRMTEEFDHWRDSLPASFSATISWPHLSPEPDPNNFAQDSSPKEIWYSNDLCAMSMMFYHMARILLLIHRPVDVFLTRHQPLNQSDLLATYNSLQRDIRAHVTEIIPIARGLPHSRVRKYMLQPLYVAGRCFTDANDRRELFKILCHIESDLGSATEYRMKDLSGEWGIPFEIVNRIGVDAGLLDM
ncbi:hypothetical protein AWENTII_007172 [Aspergillus wentii]|nr:hypothetical protein MW887_011588 [Aspergillus wentii]